MTTTDTVHAIFKYGQTHTVCQLPINANRLNLREYSRVKGEVTCQHCNNVLDGLSMLYCVDNTCRFTNTAMDGSPSDYPRVHRRTGDCDRSPSDVKAAVDQRALDEAVMSVGEPTEDPELRVHRDDAVAAGLSDFTAQDSTELERIIGVLRCELEEGMLEGMTFHLGLFDRAAELASAARYLRMQL